MVCFNSFHGHVGGLLVAALPLFYHFPTMYDVSKSIYVWGFVVGATREVVLKTGVQALFHFARSPMNELLLSGGKDLVELFAFRSPNIEIRMQSPTRSLHALYRAVAMI